ncbi:MAG: hypothetical protein DRQ13_07380 [Ignavibacteriae bacterium]|nr:MAG: hypothetical protein DRQ13_07380 [Ignavibacteriota bacterium]
MALKATEEQVLYAKILNTGMLIGLVGLVVAFVFYASGILEPLIPLEKVQSYWILSVHEYLEQSGIQAGWAWFGNLQFGDMLNFLPIAFLSLLTIVCYIAIIPGLIRKKDTAYVVIAFLEIFVLAVAASGILGTGGH